MKATQRQTYLWNLLKNWDKYYSWFRAECAVSRTHEHMLYTLKSFDFFAVSTIVSWRLRNDTYISSLDLIVITDETVWSLTSVLWFRKAQLEDELLLLQSTLLMDWFHHYLLLLQVMILKTEITSTKYHHELCNHFWTIHKKSEWEK